LEQTIIRTAIPIITDQFNSVGDIGWYGSVYFLTGTALQPAYGRMYMLFDMKWSFLVVIFIFELGSLICAIAPNSATLIGGRAVAGTGVGGIFSGALVILSLTDTAPTGRSLLQRILDLDLIGITLLLPTLICLLLALQWGEKAMLPPRIMKMRTSISLSRFSFGCGGAYYLLMYYLPIYFQGVRNVSAVHSGIDILPILIAQSISSVVIGAGVSVVGYYTPFLIGSTALFCIGAELLTLYTTSISTGKWIGYQILTGVGVGAGFQIPMTAIQTILEQADVSIGSAFQRLGGASFISVEESVFENSFVKQISETAPDVSPRLILDAGAMAFRTALADAGQIDELEVVLDAYTTGLRDVFWVALAMALFAFVSSLPLEW
ncbi:hypothetical protein ASPNIDRAFT_121822, partial [Aspergillus niger ATCC 1015]